MTLTEEQLIAYADGEVSGDDRRAIESELKTRPDLRLFVERQRALRQHFASDFAPSADEDIPDRLLRAVAETPVSARWHWRQRFEAWTEILGGRRFVLRTAMPAGAALALGLAIGVFVTPQGSFRLDNGTMLAQGRLSTALDRQLASAQRTADPVRVGISFKSKDGRYCRTFTQSALAGVACRETKGWAIAALAAAPAESGPYRMAAAMPETVRRTVEDMIAGDPLDAAAEARARDAGWRAR